ncbi:MAG: J domain-containing protein [Wolbachia endosymbiont of Tyrophagus putrescentiae]|nr:J domain-containing protein [Wolbachia endosymbiont of Tyrophagus putrescentiae]
MKRHTLNRQEYKDFAALFAQFGIEKGDVVDKGIEEINKIFNQRRRKLLLECHPDKTANKKSNAKMYEINPAKSHFEAFILRPLQDGLNGVNNLRKELRKTLWSLNFEELQEYFSESSRVKFLQKEQSISTAIRYSTYSSSVGGCLRLIFTIAFFVQNGLLSNIPIALGFFLPFISEIILDKIATVIEKNNKPPTQQCKDFSEKDKTKLKWVKNILIVQDVIAYSLMSCGIGLDIAVNGFRVVNSMLLCSSLLMLPHLFLFVASPVTEYYLKKTAIDLIQDQFKDESKIKEGEINYSTPLIGHRAIGWVI